MAEFYGGAGYGGVGEDVWAGEVTPTGSLAITIIRPAFSSTIGPSGTIDNLYITDLKAVDGSLSSSGSIAGFAINKMLSGEITIKTDDQKTWLSGNDILEGSGDGFYSVADGLQKSISYIIDNAPMGASLDGDTNSFIYTDHSESYSFDTCETFKFMWLGRLNKWNNATNYAFIAKHDDGINQKGIKFTRNYVGSDVKLKLIIHDTPTGSAAVDIDSSAIVVSDNEMLWVGVEYNTSTGDYTFYKADPNLISGNNWDGWQTVNTGTTTAVIPNASTSSIELGSINQGAEYNLYGYIAKSKVIIDDILVADFNPSKDFVHGEQNITSKSSGAVWKMMGGAHLSNFYDVGLDGSAGSFISTPDDSAWTFSGTYRIVVRAAATDWSAAADQDLMSHFSTSSERSWRFGLDTSGNLQWVRSTNGLVGTTVTQASSAPSLTNGSTYWLGVEYVTSTGAIAFYKADGDIPQPPPVWSGWTQVSTHSITSGTPYNANVTLRIGADGDGSARFAGRIFSASLYNGAVLLADFDPGLDATDGNKFYSSQTGELWSINGAGKLSPETISVRPSGSVLVNKGTVHTVTGGISPSSSVSTFQYFMYDHSISGSVDFASQVEGEIADPNDLDRLIIANAQKTLPKVKAYWSNGKFTSNLIAFSSSDIYQDKTLALNPVLNWRFDESSPGSIAADSSPNDYDGRYVGSISRVDGALKGPNDNTYGIYLSGSAYAFINSNSNLNLTDNFQIECWIKIPATPATEMFVFSKGNGSSNIQKQFALTIDTSRNINAYAYSGANEYVVNGDDVINLNEWYHVVFSIKNKKLQLFINGVEDGTYATLTGTGVNTTTGSLVVGRSSSGSNYYRGSIDELAIYPAVKMSAASAYARYRSGINEGTYYVKDRFYPEQVMNGHQRVSYVWGVTDTKDFNGHTITANGSVHAMEEADSYRYEHGWWSRSISEPDGKMDFVETVVCEFDPHPANEVHVYTSEFFAGAREIDIYYKNTSDIWTPLVLGVIIGIDEYSNIVSLGGLIDIKGIRVDVKSIWASEDVARIEEIDPIYVTDISESVVDFSIAQTREEYDSNIPIGYASANSLTMTLDNTALQYSVYNSSGQYYGLLLPDVRFEVEVGWLGTEFNYVPKGTYWADEWQESSDSMTVTVQCRDYSKFLQEITNTGNVWFDTSGAEAISNILKESNYPLFDINADLPFNDAVMRTNAAGAWMMHEGNDNQYILDWPESNDGYAYGRIANGPTGDFTLMFWLKCQSQVSTSAEVLNFSRSAFYGSNHVRVWNPTKMTVSIGSNNYYTGIRLNDNVWHHVAISWQRTTGAIKVYDNGVLKSSGTTAAGTSLSAAYDLYIGRSSYKGRMGAIALVGKVMTSQEINDMAFRNILAAEKDVKIHYPMIEGYIDSGNTSTIYSTVNSRDKLNMYNLTYTRDTFLSANNIVSTVNGTYYGAVDTGSDDSAFSIEPYNKSAFFYGDNPGSMYFNSSDTPGLSTSYGVITTITEDIDIFIRLSAESLTSGTQFLVGQHPGSNSRNYSVSILSSGKIRYTYSTNGSSDTNVDSTQSLPSLNVSPNEKFWLRISHDINYNNTNNVVTFKISKENTNDFSSVGSWTEVSRHSNSGVLAGRYQSTANITVGMDSASANKFKGNIYALRISSGIDSGDVRMEFTPDNFTNKLATTFLDNIGNTWNVGGAVPYVGDSSFMYIAPNEVHDVLNDSFSIGVWVKFKDNLSNCPIISKESISNFNPALYGGIPYRNATLGSIEIGITDLGQVYVNSGQQSSAVCIPSIQVDQWHFIFVTYNIDTKYVTIFVDGEECGGAYFSNGFTDNSLPWLLGSNGRGGWLGDGANLNGFVIYDYLLSSASVKNLYRSGSSLVPVKFPLVWTEEGETLWDVMLQVATADLGTFYFSDENLFIYKNSINNYSDAFEEFAIPQWYFYDDIDLISGDQTISLQVNKIIVRTNNIGIDLFKKEPIWSAPDNTSITGGILGAELSATFTEYLEYDTKTIVENGVPIKIPEFLPSGYVKINNEIIGYSRKDEYRLYQLTRGAFDTQPAIHLKGQRLREALLFNIDYQSKPAVVLERPFLTAVIEDKSVDIDFWQSGLYGAKLLISRNETRDAYLVQNLQNVDPLNNIANYFSLSGTALTDSSSNESQEFQSSEYAESIRRYGIKQVEFTNRFLSNKYAAKLYADYFLAHFQSPVPIIDVGITGNPLINLGDRVKIVTMNRMGMSQEEYWVEAIEFMYNGGIEQKLVLRKVT